MSDALKIYAIDEVSIIAFGIPLDSGFADGEVLRIEPVGPAYTTKLGADGQVTRSKTNDKRAKITIRLMQTSSLNAALSAVYALDDLGENGAGVGPFLAKDRQGTSLHFASKVWIEQRPDVVYGVEADVREWHLMAADLNGLDGGN